MLAVNTQEPTDAECFKKKKEINDNFFTLLHECAYLQ